MIWTDENHSDYDHLVSDIDITVATLTPATPAGDQTQSIKQHTIKLPGTVTIATPPAIDLE